MSIDGYIDDASERRLVLSDDADLDRVDEIRAGCDAILVGAATIRRDNPRLLVRSQARQRERVARGLPPSPVRVALTRKGDLDPAARFFTAEAAAAGDSGLTQTDAPGDSGLTQMDAPAGSLASASAGVRNQASRLVYVATPAADQVRERLGPMADVIDAGNPVDLRRVLSDLAGRGIARLMVEGGSSVLTQFLTAGLADELQLAVAPFFVGDSRAPRFVADGRFAQHSGHQARLADVRQLDDLVVLTYALSGRFGSTRAGWSRPAAAPLAASRTTFREPTPGLPR